MFLSMPTYALYFVDCWSVSHWLVQCLIDHEFALHCFARLGALCRVLVAWLWGVAPYSYVTLLLCVLLQGGLTGLALLWYQAVVFVSASPEHLFWRCEKAVTGCKDCHL